MPKITNIKELRNDLIDNYDMLKRDPKRLNQVAELANTAGKIVMTVKMELEYCAATGVVPNIDFLQYDGSSEKSLALPAAPVAKNKSLAQ